MGGLGRWDPGPMVSDIDVATEGVRIAINLAEREGGRISPWQGSEKTGRYDDRAYEDDISHSPDLKGWILLLKVVAWFKEV